MTCQEVVARLSDYIDGTVTPPLSAAIEAHIGACHGCHVVLDSTQCTILLSRAAQTTTLSPERRAELVRRLEATCRDCRAGRSTAG